MNLKKSPHISIAVQIVGCLLLLLCLGMSAACRQPDVVMYEVIGSITAADIQVTSPDGTMDKYEDAGLPWRFTYEGFENAQAYVYAHNNTEEGSITVNIYVNGRLVRTATSTGPYVTAVTYWDR
jgi:hypothetical protein